jgi:hypothetical protein
MLKRLFPLLAVMACSTGPTDEGATDLLVRSDKPSYSLSVDHSAVPLLINRSGRPVYLPMNQYVAVEHLAEGTWQQGVVWFEQDGDGVSFRLDSGDSVDAIPMDFAYIDREPGQYRFVFEVALDSQGHTRLPSSATRSAPFRYDPRVVAPEAT